jgi:hypothetical protein
MLLHPLYSNVRWMIQIPRLFAEYKKAGLLTNFQQMIDSMPFALLFCLRHCAC